MNQLLQYDLEKNNPNDKLKYPEKKVTCVTVNLKKYPLIQRYE